MLCFCFVLFDFVLCLVPNINLLIWIYINISSFTWSLFLSETKYDIIIFHIVVKLKILLIYSFIIWVFCINILLSMETFYKFKAFLDLALIITLNKCYVSKWSSNYVHTIYNERYSHFYKELFTLFLLAKATLLCFNV